MTERAKVQRKALALGGRLPRPGASLLLCCLLTFPLLMMSFVAEGEGAASGGAAAKLGLHKGDTWSVQGTLSVQSKVTRGDVPPIEKTDAVFVFIETTVQGIDDNELVLIHEVRRYPPMAELWSKKKRDSTEPLSKGLILQRFPVLGANAGLGGDGGTFMAPVVEDYFLPLLLPDAFVKGDRFHYGVPVRNPIKPDEPPWDAMLALEVDRVDERSASMEYEYRAPEQSRPNANGAIRFQSLTEGSVTIELDTKRTLYQRGEQTMEFSSGDRLKRVERVVFELTRVQ